jgi:hypothetical protein
MAAAGAKAAAILGICRMYVAIFSRNLIENLRKMEG